MISSTKTGGFGAMPTTTQLYAWAVPAFIDESPVDHTWATSYDNRMQNFADVAAVIAANQDYWLCWGDYHAKGGTPSNPSGFLGSQSGDLNVARCLVQPNADCSSTYAARGTIFTYGVDGVCHQLANQVLYSTRASGVPPLTVAKARGYWVSAAIYGTYGLQHAAWSSKIAACTAAARPQVRRGKARRQMSTPPPAAPPDEFAQRVTDVLGPDRLPLAAQLLHLRAQFQMTAALQAHTARVPTADELNDRNQRFLDEAAKILSERDYERIFGVKIGLKVKVVRPDMMK
jgi:hypothetical protein